MLLTNRLHPFPKQLVDRLAEIFELDSAVLYEHRTGEFYLTGTPDQGHEDLQDQLRRDPLYGMTPSDLRPQCVIVPVRLGSEAIASLALQGVAMPESVLQGIANLVAI